MAKTVTRDTLAIEIIMGVGHVLGIMKHPNDSYMWTVLLRISESPQETHPYVVWDYNHASRGFVNRAPFREAHLRDAYEMFLNRLVLWVKKGT